jgi:hypothetical protein
VTESRLEGGE